MSRKNNNKVKNGNLSIGTGYLKSTQRFRTNYVIKI